MILKQAVFLPQGLWAAGGNHAVPFCGQQVAAMQCRFRLVLRKSKKLI
jgi:hypothetical protein